MRKRLEPDDRRDQIIAGALQAFATKGFGATNREIADAAGLNSATLIYHYFPSKSDLLLEVVQKYAPPLQLLNQSEALLDLPLRELLTRIGTAYLGILEAPHAVSLMKVLMGEALRQPELASVFGQAGPARMIAFLTQIMARHMELGNLRRADPQWAARAFLGPMMTILFTKVFLGLDSSLSPAETVESAVETFLHGMAAETR